MHSGQLLNSFDNDTLLRNRFTFLRFCLTAFDQGMSHAFEDKQMGGHHGKPIEQAGETRWMPPGTNVYFAVFPFVFYRKFKPTQPPALSFRTKGRESDWYNLYHFP